MTRFQDREYLTVTEAAKRFGRSASGIRAIAEKVPGAVRAGREWLLPLEELEKWEWPKRGRPARLESTSTP